ncbi:MAG: hypothetical protein GY708_00595, partial [Actinomycetia bacterium]|nr:hypothetical protein [Actinomycetes bacterium]
MIDAIGPDGLDLIVAGTSISLAALIDETGVSVADLLRFSLVDEDDLHSDLANVDLADVFVQGSVDAAALLSSDVLETAIVADAGLVVTQDAAGDDVIAIAELTSLPYVSAADLIRAGLVTSLDFNLSAATVEENDLLAWGLVTPNKLDNNNLVQDTNPDTVNVGDLVSLGVATLEDLAEQMTPAELQLTTTDILLSSVYASNVLGTRLLESEGLPTSGAVDIEQLIAAGPATEDELVEAGLIHENDFWDTSVITLLQLYDELVGDGKPYTEATWNTAFLVPDSTVPLDKLLASDVVNDQYIEDAVLDPDADNYVLIADLLSDIHVTFEELVTGGLLRASAFVNKVYELSDLEALEVESEPRFEDGQLDRLVSVGTVGLDTLLASPLYDVTLEQYIAAEFVDVFDFENVDLDVTTLNTDFGFSHIDYPVTIPLRTLVALDFDALVLTEITLLDLLDAGYIDEGDLATPVVELDIRALEASDLFETGDLNNYISAYEVRLYDLVNEIYIGQLVTLGELEAADLIVNNLGSLMQLVDDGVLAIGDFQDAALSAATLDGDGIASMTDLNALNLVYVDSETSQQMVSLHDLVDSGLTTLSELIDEGLVVPADVAVTVTGLEIDDIGDSDLLDQALLDANSLVTGTESDQVFLNGATSLLSEDVATLRALIRAGVVDPSYLQPAAQVDKDVLVDGGLATLSDLIDAGLIAVSDINISAFDVQQLDTFGVLPMSDLTSIDQMIALGIVTAEQVDGLSTVAGADLVGSGLVTEQDLVDEGLFGTHVNLAGLLASELVTIDELKTAGLDDRSGRVDLQALLAAGSLTVTLGDLQTEGLVSEDVEIDQLLESELVTLLELVQTRVDKAALIAAPLGDPVTESELIAASLFDPNVEIPRLVESGLVTAEDLVDGSLIGANIDSAELITVNLVAGQQLVDTGLITQGELDTETFPAVSVVTLLAALLDGGDANSHLVTLDDLAYYAFFAADAPRGDLIG